MAQETSDESVELPVVRVARRLQDMGWEVGVIAQDAIQSNIEAAQRLSQCRSIEEAVDIQSECTKKVMTSALDHGRKVFDLAGGLAADMLVLPIAMPVAVAEGSGKSEAPRTRPAHP